MSEENAPLKKGGRVAFSPTPLMRRQARAMATLGLTQEQSAGLFEVSETTFKKYLGDEFAAGVVDYDGAVVNNLRRHALGDGAGAVTAGIYWTKVRLGWSEKSRLEVSFDQRILRTLIDGVLDVMHRLVPEFCPHCKTALALKKNIAAALVAESQKLIGLGRKVAAAAPGAEESGA